MFTVNGRQQIHSEATLTFEQLVRLAFRRVGDDELAGYTVTLRHGPKGGTLAAGQSVDVLEGMVVNVARTDGA